MGTTWCVNGCGAMVYGSKYCRACFQAKLAQFRASCEFAKVSAGGEHEEVNWEGAFFELLAETYGGQGRQYVRKHVKKVPNVAKVQMDPDDLLVLLDLVEGK